MIQSLGGLSGFFLETMFKECPQEALEAMNSPLRVHEQLKKVDSWKKSVKWKQTKKIAKGHKHANENEVGGHR